MSCPFFYARDPLNSPGIRPVPLGRLHSGECLAASDPATPANLDLCNFGYARGECPRFPADAEADAVRFAIDHVTEAAVTVRYCLERDHRPARHGTLDVTPGAPESGGIVEHLAAVYVASFLARKKS